MPKSLRHSLLFHRDEGFSPGAHSLQSVATCREMGNAKNPWVKSNTITILAVTASVPALGQAAPCQLFERDGPGTG